MGLDYLPVCTRSCLSAKALAGVLTMAKRPFNCEQWKLAALQGLGVSTNR